MAQYLLLEHLQEDALKITETFLTFLTQASPLTRKQAMEVRQLVFPHVASFLSDEPFLYQESLNVLKTLLASQTNNPTVLVGQTYPFSQKDIDDGLSNYKDTEEFEGLVRAIQWGKKWDGYRRTHVKAEASPTALAKELYRSIIHMIDGSTQNLKHQTLSAGCDASDNAHNKKVIFYHARKLATILRQQPSSFVAQQPYGESQKNTNDPDKADNNEEGKEDTQDAQSDIVVLTDIERLVEEKLKPLLEEATAYRQTVAKHAPSLHTPQLVSDQGELFIGIEERAEEFTPKQEIETEALKPKTL